MGEIQDKRKIWDRGMLFSIFFGASIGAVLGIIAYVNNWLG